MKNTKTIRFLAMLLAVLMFTALFPVPQAYALTSTGVTSIPIGSLSPEDYYRLLYANNVFEFDGLTFDYEKTDFEFKELTNNERLIGLYKDASMALNISGLVLGFIPKIGPLLKEACKAGVSSIQKELAFNTFAEIPKRLNELGTQMNDLYDALVSSLDSQTRKILNGLETLENKVDIEKYVNTLIAFNKTDFDSFGGYYQWKEQLFTAYEEVLLYQNSESVADMDMKESFDALYVVASQNSALYNAMIGDQYPEDYSVQEALFNYYLLKNAIHGESVDLAETVNNCVDFANDLYASYVFSQICMNLCYQYQVEYLKKEHGNNLTTKSYYLSETVNSQDRRISYYSVIKPFIEKGSENIEMIETELSQYYTVILNLCESYHIVSDGQTNRVIYNELTDVNPGNAVSVTKEGALERYVIRNCFVSVGDVLYLNPLPMILTSSFIGTYSFVSNDPSVAQVTADGVVTVKQNGNFSVSLKYGDSVVYTMYFSSQEKFSGGSGSATSPYLLSTEEDLIMLASDSNYWKEGYYFKMISDIHITNVPQIGSLSTPFYGVFDGNGHTVSGINQTAKALFGVNYGTIKNLTVSGAHISAGFRESLSNTRGGVCDGNAGLMENVHLIASTVYCENYSDNISANGSNYYTTVATHIGGIAGENDGTIRNCSVKYSDFLAYQRNGTLKFGALGIYEIAAPTISYVNMGAIVGTNTKNGVIEYCLSTNNTEYTHIKSVSGYTKYIWNSATKHLCVASFRMGGLVGEDLGVLTYSVAYNNTSSKDWTYDTKNDVDAFNSPQYIKKEEVYKNDFVGYERGDAGLCLSNTETSSELIEQMTEAGWVWGENPYFDATGTGGISVQKRPAKIAYAKNSVLNLSGLVLKTEDGIYITEGYSVSSCDTSTYGTKMVEVEWNGKKTSFEVEIVCFHENIDVVDSADNILNEDVICMDCGQRLYILENSRMLDHTHKFENYESVDDENHKAVCECDEILMEVHDFDEKIIKASTHTEKGEKLFTCKVCGYLKTEVIPENANAHSYTKYEDYNKDQHKAICECGAYILESHDWELLKTTPATHTQTGLSEYGCKECGANKEEAIPVTPDHIYTGYVNHDSDLHKVFCECSSYKLEVHTWDYENAVQTKPATHMEKGEKKISCKYCGATKTEEIAKLTEHSYDHVYEVYNTVQHKAMCECGAYKLETHTWDYDSAVETKPATHMEKGEKTVPCKYCGETKTEEIAKLTEHSYNHTYETYNTIQHKAICECGSVIYEAHAWDSACAVETKPATHMEKGEKTVPCKYCGETKTEEIAKLTEHSYHHAYETYSTVQHKAMCECGSFVYEVHVWDEENAVISKMPTHLEEGEKQISCKDCGAVKIESIEQLTEHTFGEWISSAQGQHSRSCVCGESETESCVWNDGTVMKEPTYKEEGYSSFICVICGSEKTEILSVLPTKSEVTSDGNKIKVEVPNGSSAMIDANTVLNAEQIGPDVYGTTKENLSALLGNKSTVLAAYDISLLLDGVSVQPNGKIEITLPAPDGMGDYESVKVVFIADDGSVTDCETAVNADGTVTFVTDHLSCYAIVGIAPEVNLLIPALIAGAVAFVVVAIAVIIKKRKSC